MKKKSSLAQEFIGKNIKIVDSSCKSLIGLQGAIIDETKNTFTVQTSKGRKKIIKHQVEILVNDQKINGRKITKKPEDRIKLRT